jgi:ankyrin repeat protein
MLFFLSFLLMQAPDRPQVPDTRSAITRALPLLQQSAGEFAAKRSCVSCHHNILPILALHLARARGFDIDGSVLGAVEERTFADLHKPNAFDNAVQAATINDPTPNDSFLLMAANAAGIRPDLTTAVYARRIAGWQRDGHWITSDFRPPHSSSEFTATASAIRAMRLYMPEELRVLADQSIARARHWMLENHPVSTEDAAFRLMGLVWAGAPPKEIQISQRDLLSMQLPDGGWSQLRHYGSDAYSTGEALYALSEAGMPSTETVWKNGMLFLISNQAADGTWHVQSRMESPATVSPPYFQTGFPYGHDEFLSYAGSSWALMALLRSLPETPHEFGSSPGPPIEAGWERTALFGSVAQLRALLDAGLSPDTSTKNGTSMLMMAAPDAGKVQLLLSRGANAKARSPAGIDALTIASAYRGTAASIQLLSKAGAEANPPENVHLRNAPLTLAAMTGDIDNVRMLLTAGAEPDSEALSEAVTFGYPEVLKALVRAGADPAIAESSGINMLHWAAITNRPGLIPILASMGVSVNAQDHNGYSPLMYAVTLDFGETRAIQALLKAGADRKLANSEGRSAIEQALYLKHMDMLQVLR